MTMTSEKYNLNVGADKLASFEHKPDLEALAELALNSIDADATQIDIKFQRTPLGVIDLVTVSDNGTGITPEIARSSFKDWGDSWKPRQVYSPGGRVLSGRKGEGRLYTYSLGNLIRWTSAAVVEDRVMKTVIDVDLNDPRRWSISEPVESDGSPGTQVEISVPDSRSLRALSADEAAFMFTMKIAGALMAYPEVRVSFDDKRIDFNDAVARTYTVPLDLKDEHASDSEPPRLTLVEWRAKTRTRNLVIKDSTLRTVCYGRDSWNDAILNFTPVLTTSRFDGVRGRSIDVAVMQNSQLLQTVDTAIKEYISEHARLLSGQVVRSLSQRGIYPYDRTDMTPSGVLERQTFDMIVTFARHALPEETPSLKLTVELLRTALEKNPGKLRNILGKILKLSDEEQADLDALLSRTTLPAVIRAGSTITDRLTFIHSLRRALQNPETRERMREVDQLHPMISDQMWIFGEDWPLSSTETGLTEVYRRHLALLQDGDESILVEEDLVKRPGPGGAPTQITQPDGRSGRVDLVMYRRFKTDREIQRLVIELKRPNVQADWPQLTQISKYAEALTQAGPSETELPCKWQFILITDEVHKNLKGMRSAGDRPRGMVHRQDNYEIWIKTWGEILDSAETRLDIFRKELDFVASDAAITQWMSARYDWWVTEPAGPAELVAKEHGAGGTAAE